MPIVHLAARTRPGFAPFDSFAAASWTWRRLRAAFPEALSVTLMPNHVQLVVEVDRVDAARAHFARTLGHLQRWLQPGVPLWETVREPKVVAPGGPLYRELRYVDLNAPRAGLVEDPIAWPWTTLRDVMGAVVDPWVDAERLARALRSRSPDFRTEWYAYVTGDPSVAVQGTPPPRPARPTSMSTRPLSDVLRATAAALRLPVAEVRSSIEGRRMFVALARHQGWSQTAVLAAALRVSPRTVERCAAVDPAALQAAAMCLGDPRLLAAFVEGSPDRARSSRARGGFGRSQSRRLSPGATRAASDRTQPRTLSPRASELMSERPQAPKLTRPATGPLSVRAQTAELSSAATESAPEPRPRRQRRR